jgi:hypothetical protein
MHGTGTDSIDKLPSVITYETTLFIHCEIGSSHIFIYCYGSIPIEGYCIVAVVLLIFLYQVTGGTTIAPQIIQLQPQQMMTSQQAPPPGGIQVAQLLGRPLVLAIQYTIDGTWIRQLRIIRIRDNNLYKPICSSSVGTYFLPQINKLHSPVLYYT